MAREGGFVEVAVYQNWSRRRRPSAPALGGEERCSRRSVGRARLAPRRSRRVRHDVVVPRCPADRGCRGRPGCGDGAAHPSRRRWRAAGAEGVARGAGEARHLRRGSSSACSWRRIPRRDRRRGGDTDLSRLKDIHSRLPQGAGDKDAEGESSPRNAKTACSTTCRTLASARCRGQVQKIVTPTGNKAVKILRARH